MYHSEKDHGTKGFALCHQTFFSMCNNSFSLKHAERAFIRIQKKGSITQDKLHIKQTKKLSNNDFSRRKTEGA